MPPEEKKGYILCSEEEWKDICRRIEELEKGNASIQARLDAIDITTRLHDDLILLVQAIQGLTDTLVKNSL